jgi:hypothetical protein
MQNLLQHPGPNRLAGAELIAETSWASPSDMWTLKRSFAAG